MSPKLARYAPLTGVLFLILMAVGLFAFPSTPDPTDATVKVTAFWQGHRTQQMWAAYIGGLAAIALIWFGGSLRERINTAAGGNRLGGLALVGATVGGVGLLLYSALGFTAADTAGKVPAEVTQTLSVMSTDLFAPLAGGLFVMMLAAALASLYWGVLPKWLGWIALVIAIVQITPVGFFAFLAAILWVGVVGGWLFAKAPSALAGA